MKRTIDNKWRTEGFSAVRFTDLSVSRRSVPSDESLGYFQPSAGRGLFGQSSFSYQMVVRETEIRQRPQVITVDQNLPYQQNIAGLNIAILILAAKRNSYVRLKPLVPRALSALASMKVGDVIRIEE